MAPPAPSQPESRTRSLPRWLKRKVPKGDAEHFTSKLIEQLDLQTVCRQARCPNRMECYARKTATFMILGQICTRGCAFCSVRHGRPGPPDPDEPRRVAEATARLGLRHVVVTCVTRDDLPDGGADHFCRTIASVREATRATIEVLPSDFGGNLVAVDQLLASRPDVYNHNTETVPRLYPTVRGPKADYRWTLRMFRRIAAHSSGVSTKTGMMLGLGETTAEVVDTLAELRDAGVEMLTLGQYLQPSPQQMPVVRYVEPAEFDHLAELARSMGYRQVAAGPFVRSSYHAAEMATDAFTAGLVPAAP
jgi:lipoyl synthase